MKAPVMCSPFKAFWLLLCVWALQSPAQAQDVPDVKASLKKMLASLPIEGIKDEVEGMVGALKKSSCGGGLTGCYATQSGPLQLYFFTGSSAQQTLLLVIDKKVAMPRILGDKVQKVMGETSLSSPIIAISTTDFSLDTIKMPPSLQKVVRDNYFNVSSLSFAAGVQMAARANLGGAIKLRMEFMGVKSDQMTIRAAVVMPIPTDLASGAGAGAGLAMAMQEGETMKKSGADAIAPTAFVEFQFAPNAVLNLTMPQMTLTDATFFLDNELMFGYRGNASFKGAENRKIITHFQTRLTPLAAIDFLDFQIYMSTPAKFTMEDAAHVMFAMATPDSRLASYGGGFIRNIESFKNPLLQAATPLSVFQLTNPNPAEYRFGDSSKPFPSDKSGSFNIIVAGPLVKDGPLLHAVGNVRILGQKMGWLDATAGLSGLNGIVGESIVIKLGPLGKLSVKMVATVAIDKGQQLVNLMGNLDGQKIAVTLNGSTMGVEVSASCVNPFQIKASLAIKADTDIAQVFDGQAGANVDPSKIGGCVGKQLEAAYNKIAGEYSQLSGYSAKLANAELKKISDAAADEALKDYNKVKDTARDVASKSTSAATNAFNDAGNAFKKLGKKKKHKKGPDPKFAGSVFDWDYYYDNNPDLRKSGVDLSAHWKDSGFAAGRRGSLEFSAPYYLKRYADVASACPGNNLLCALQHWLDYGIEMGRQGSPDFSVVSYMNRYADVPRTLAPEDDPDALEHWLTSGFDAGRDGRPASTATGSFSPPTRAGGGGGGPWNDAAQCKNLYVIGFRVSSGDRVDGVQFLYSNNQWGVVHGTMKTNTADVTLPAGQYIEQVNYRSGSMMDAVGFLVNTGIPAFTPKKKKGLPTLTIPEIPGPDPSIHYEAYGMYGGNGGSYASYVVTSGERLACMTGRSGAAVDQLIFSSTGQR